MQKTVLFLNMIEEDPTKRLKLVGARRYAAAAGWNLVPVKYGHSIRKNIPKLLAEYRPVGCICDEDATPTRFSPGMFCGIPVVFANAYGNGHRATIRIGVDNAAVARAAFRELAAGQPEEFAVVGDSQPLEWSLARMRMFCAEAKAVNTTCHAFREKKWRGRAAAVAALRPFVAKLPRHTAIYAVNDIIARRIADAARAEGRRIPQDLTLLGTDNDIAVCNAASPTITSIQLDFERMGYLAAKMLGKMLARPEPNGTSGATGTACASHSSRLPQMSHSTVVTIGPLLAVRRESTGGYGRREPHVLEAVEIIRREACEGLSVAELALAPLLANCGSHRALKPVTQFPAVKRDIAVVAPEALASGDIVRAITKAGGKLLTGVSLFDIFKPKNSEDAKRSLAYSLEFRSPERTLTDDEVNAACANVMVALKKLPGVEVREG